MFSWLRYLRYLLHPLHSSDFSITNIRSVTTRWGVPAARGSLHLINIIFSQTDICIYICYLNTIPDSMIIKNSFLKLKRVNFTGHQGRPLDAINVLSAGHSCKFGFHKYSGSNLSWEGLFDPSRTWMYVIWTGVLVSGQQTLTMAIVLRNYSAVNWKNKHDLWRV